MFCHQGADITLHLEADNFTRSYPLDMMLHKQRNSVIV